MTVGGDQPIQPRRLVGWALVAGLSIAALTASFALLSGELDDTDWKVIGTSLGFSLCSALGASGTSLRLRADWAKRALGAVTVLLAATTFVLWVALIWSEFDGEALTRAWGSVAVCTLAASHASLMVAGRRATDSEAVATLTSVSIALGALDAFMTLLPTSGLIGDVDEELAELFGVLVIALLLTTAMVPILRRMQAPAAAAAAAGSPVVRPQRTDVLASAELAAEVASIADRIQDLNGHPARHSEIRRECERLRELARTYSA